MVETFKILTNGQREFLEFVVKFSKETYTTNYKIKRILAENEYGPSYDTDFLNSIRDIYRDEYLINKSDLTKKK